MKPKFLMAEVDAGGGGASGAAAPVNEGAGSAAAPVPAGGRPSGDGEAEQKPERTDGRNALGQFAAKDGEKPKQEAPPKFRTKVQVKFKGKDGKEVVQEDDVDEDRLRQSYQVERGLRMKAEETTKALEEKDRQIAEIRARLEAAIRGDARAILPENVNPFEWHGQQLEKLLAEHAMDPKDREIATLRAQNEEFMRAEQERVQKEQEAADRREAAGVVEHIGAKVIPLIEQAGLPKNDLALERAVKFYYSARRQGIDDPDPSLIAEEVVGEFTQTMESLVEKMDGEKLLKAFPKLSGKVAAALRDRFQALRAKPAPAPQKTPEERAAAAAKNGGQAAEEPRQPRLKNDRELDKLLGIQR